MTYDQGDLGGGSTDARENRNETEVENEKTFRHSTSSNKNTEERVDNGGPDRASHDYIIVAQADEKSEKGQENKTLTRKPRKH